jgi:isovaleryl-CoA dehydrogenase
MNYIHYEELRPASGSGELIEHVPCQPQRRQSSSLFGLDAEQQAILDQADRFAQKELYPLSARMDLEERWPDAAFPRIGDNGFLGATMEEYGWAGLDLPASGRRPGAAGFARWNRAMALAWAAHDNLCATTSMGAAMSSAAKYLPDLCVGRKVGALGICDPEILRRCAL